MRTLRARFALAMILLVLGVVMVSVVLTFFFTRRAALDTAKGDLEARGLEIMDQLDALEATVRNSEQDPQQRTQAVRTIIGRTLVLANARLVVLREDGTVEEQPVRYTGENRNNSSVTEALTLPDGIDAEDLDVEALFAGENQSDNSRTTAFFAMPVTEGFLSVPGAADPAAETTVPVIILSQQVDAEAFGGIGLTFLLVAAGATFIAIVIALLLARRLTRPVNELRRVASQLAAGDLAARADLGTTGRDELGELARTLNGMAERLEAVQGAERAFLMSVSHDFRTPLTSIRGYAEALGDGTIEDPEARSRAASVIRSESERLERLVRDLLDLARLDAHEFSMTPQPCEAGDVVRSSAEAFQPAAASAGVTLSVSAAPVTVDADPIRLGQIVGNLVENALKYAGSLVQVSAGATDGALVIAVDDDGPGIPPEDQPRVFERLYTARGTPGRSVGTGLGLAIVGELAGAMGGYATVEPLDTGGTRFSVVLPVVRAGSQAGA